MDAIVLAGAVRSTPTAARQQGPPYSPDQSFADARQEPVAAICTPLGC